MKKTIQTAKRLMPYNVYIPTIGYPIGKATKDVNKIIKYAIEARRQATTDEEQASYNQILTDAYDVKYAE